MVCIIKYKFSVDKSKICEEELKLMLDNISESLKTENGESFWVALKSTTFILTLIMATCGVFYTYTIYNVCKTFGLNREIDEELLFILVTSFAFVNGISRAFYGFLSDKIGFKKLYRVFILIEVIFNIFFLDNCFF